MKLRSMRLPISGILSAALAVGAIITVKGCSMTADTTMILFSQVQGTVTRNGQPVEGAEVVQKVLYKSEGEVPEAITRTGSGGGFNFEEISRDAPKRWLPGEITITQSIVIHHDGKEYQGWNHGKEGFEANSELDGRPLRLVCELSTEPDVDGTHYGICREATD